ncbi:hypothetical protein, partial [Thermomicrobium sp.]|uniref:hypothetical protein n=1 Tax=Thermomicrobium sp. TaxID=1969469 RepID=UPI001B0E5B83
MPQTWWCDETTVHERAWRRVRAELRYQPDWLAFLERCWQRKWDDFWPDYAEDFDLATDEAEAEAVLDQLVERFVDWIRDY